MIKYVASYYLTTFVNSEFWITSSKLWRKQRKARISKFQIQIKVLIKLEKSPQQTAIFKEKKEVDQRIMIVQKILWKQSDHQEVLVARKLFLRKKEKSAFHFLFSVVFLEMSGWRLSTAIVVGLATTVIRR